jgi:hypothetical protein
MFDAVNHLLFLDICWHPVGGRFYCPVCISQTKPPAPVGWSSRSDVVNHLRGTHKWDEPVDADALSSQELIAALIQWRKDTLELGDGFGQSLRLVRGVDDFLGECETA